MSATRSVAAKALEFKGRMMTLTVLRVNTDEEQALEAALDAQFARTPEFFRSLPVIIETERETLDLTHLVKLLRARSLVPVAVYRPGAKLMQAAEAVGLGVVNDPRGTRPAPQQAEKAPAKRPSTRLLTQPVRSGQQIYARGTDLIVTSTVSPGAEVLADGCIHVYGALRGRALAGAQGDEGARIFCSDLNAELVAIAGRYRVAEDLDDELRGHAVQVALQEESLIITPFV